MSEENILKLDFYGFIIIVNCETSELIKKLSNDFQHFIVESTSCPVSLNLNLSLSYPPFQSIPKMRSTSQSYNSITYDLGSIRYNDYYGEALSILDYQNNRAKIYSENICQLHEISYLLILSRSGESLDRKGLHKIHACAVASESCAFVFMMPMKGGKSTLFLNLLKNRNFDIISDDSPLIDQSGSVLPFPLRLGLNQVPEDFSIEEKYISKIKRAQFGDKYLINIKAFPNLISNQKGEVILLNGIRYSGTESNIMSCSKIKMIRPLLVHMVIGLGLPIILEYFLKMSISDIYSKSKILFSRMNAALRLLIRAEVYTLELGQDPQKVAVLVNQFILKKNASKTWQKNRP